MTPEHISDALQYLDDELLLQTQTLRARKQGGIPMKKRLSVLMAAVLITALCCVTASAAIHGGWFSDVKNSFGAVTGTEYYNATEEITVTADAESGLLTVHVTFLVPDQFPYREIETLRFGEYTISEISGSQTDAAPVTDGTTQITVPVGNLPAGEYSLHITSFIGEKKAEQPLPIYGDWECEFTVK
ncbi:MAG: hypothetical protein IJD81_00110 [Oscillospiraceae bacterium]|nr:hypothetical protein [Oscillospiraceae bacterium]